MTTLSWLIATALVINSSLFLLRALAVFSSNKPLIALIIVLWLTLFISVTIPLSIRAAPVAGVCYVTAVGTFTSAGFIAEAIFDTAVFCAITYHILQYSLVDEGKDKLLRRACGRGMGTVSRALLQSGLFYYL